ncbi:MAG: PhoH family protein [Nitrospirota bacterium]
MYGELDKNLKLIEDILGVEVRARGNNVFIEGENSAVDTAEKLIRELSTLTVKGHVIKPEDIRYAAKILSEDKETSIKNIFDNAITVSSKRRFIVPKSEGQRLYIEAIKQYDIVIGIGPAGTGKTYLAMAMAVSALIKREAGRIILARPAVEAGEKLGYLPGDMYEKVNPYLRPLYDALYDMMETDKASKLIERGVIEIAPLAFMRGRTLNDSFVILDEAQNTTSEQMKMYLTRLGFSSKTVITGDVTQVDLPTGKTSGLIEIQRILGEIEGIKFIYFTEKDVVRHRLVQEIIKAYERHGKRDIKDEGV